ncbi:MAG: DEAD/DEAH box helicase family protein [Deltaproteobacteria bacterium]|nr:DEAD/DEAH box helicase family protein [Deltaproteobacteria bacterium]
MNYQDLLRENNRLKNEVERLTSENNRLRLLIDEESHSIINVKSDNFISQPAPDILHPENTSHPEVTNHSDTQSKIKLFMSLFKGREDVYATRWENKKRSGSGYSPVCLNQWHKDLCGKPKIPCSKCKNSSYAPLNERVIEDHLRGNIIAGVYPMMLDETCYFLAIDFDKEGWQKDISILRDVCNGFHIPVAIERSRSGNGGHAWFFFEDRLPATLARRLGTALLTYSMNKRHEIRFKSYDRFFPNQDTLPKGGFGNLIALPFQKEARKKQNSEFINEDFEPYPDQWAFLSSIKKINEDQVGQFIADLSHGHELGELKIDDEEDPKPWETTRKISISKNDLPQVIDVVKSNMLYIEKKGISEKALNHLKRLASFKNPEFYRHQAMHLSTHDYPRVISCADVTKDYLCLPRGCEMELFEELSILDVEARLMDKTNHGRKIDVEFKGSLREEQSFALNRMLSHDIGILSGSTAFGKTVVAIRLIAERKVNTLILVDKVNLLNQWVDRLNQFLVINEPLPYEHDSNPKRGRKKRTGIIGQFGGGKNTLNGVIDIALMQSLVRMGEVKDYVKDYGMIIADECHHASAFSYESILKASTAKYVYGLTATPTRKDGHHPILYMQCGPIRYRDNPKKQAENRPFDHFVIPRFTSLRIPFDRNEKDIGINDIYPDMITSDFRNQQIITDVVTCHKLGRNSVVLSQRTDHVDLLTEKLREEIPDVIKLTGKIGNKQAREAIMQIKDFPSDINITIVATGPYIGEGFDEPRLDTLFLVMPISWKGTLQQYAGRLHRLFESKKDVLIYDYVDVHIRMLEKMYCKRQSGYASMGYKIKGDAMDSAAVDIIYNRDNFLPVFSNDMINAKKEILIVSPYVKKRRVLQMAQYIDAALQNKVRVNVITRPVEDFKEKDQNAVNAALDILKGASIKVVFRSNIHQKFAIIDQKIVWYGSINLLSFGDSQESIMRLDNFNTASELIKSVEG